MVNLRWTLLFLLLSLIPITQLSAQQLNEQGKRMKRDISILASDSLQGREAGTIGERMASAYIAAQMKQIGLIPAGDSVGSYLYHFRMNYPVVYKNGMLKVNNQVLKYVEEFGATDLSAPGSATASLSDIETGEYLLDKDDISPINNPELNGKIVVMDINSAEDTKDNILIVNNISSRIRKAIDGGALAVLLHNSSRNKDEDLLFGSPYTASLSIPVLYITRSGYEKLGKQKGRICSLAIDIDHTVRKPANVIGWIDNKASKSIIICAHYDHLGIKKKSTQDQTLQVFNGADDNASGTAALLELARDISQYKNLRYNYIFVAFTAEEKGLFGSKAYASLPEINPGRIAYMLNMDMVGRLGAEGDTMSILGVASSPLWDNLLDQLPHPDFDIKKIPGAPPFSDHAPFLKKNIPVIYFTTGLHKQYHKPDDDTELINFVGMEELITYLGNFIEETEKINDFPFQRIDFIKNIKAYFSTFSK